MAGRRVRPATRDHCVVLPDGIAQLAERLAAIPGAEAVALGGSRATGTHRPDSDWDLGLYYRGEQLNPDDVRKLGHPGFVSELGEWGPIMNGGAWLTVDGTPVDVLFRDLDTIERWLADAQEGRFEILRQNGYLVGAATYLPVGELALCEPISGELPRPTFPDALATTAPARWEGQASVALMFAATYEKRGDLVPKAGMLASAILCVAHARVAERREWALNEKGLAMRAGLQAADPAGSTAEISALLGVEPLGPRL